MKNYSYIGISLVILIFGIIFIPEIIKRVQEGNVVVSDRMSIPEAESKNEEPLAYIKVNGKKKKVPSFEFIDQNGDTISNKDYKGKVYIAEFFFTTCPSICPIMNRNLVLVQNKFKNNPDFGIASFTIDPAHDTPEVLKEYAKSHGIVHPNWHLLTGDREEIYRLANSGFNIYAGKDSTTAGGFAHSGYFALVDKEGYIRSRTDKFGNPIIYYRGSIKKGTITAPGEESPQIEILIEDVKKLLNGSN